MKKSSFVTMMLATLSGVLFALGMCMALLPEWDAFKPGVILGAVGIIMGIITVTVWRKMEKKPPIKWNGKQTRAVIIAVIGALILGIGMCLCMVWESFVAGTLVGLLGILLLLLLIPIVKGVK